MPSGQVRSSTTSFVLISVLLCACCGSAGAQAGVADGKAIDPFQASQNKVTVLVFVRQDCPVSGRYAPTLQRISKEFAERAKFWLVFPDKAESAAAMRTYVAQYGYDFPALGDPSHTLTALSHVQITPEVAVFDSSRHLVYDGRIDDWYISLGKSRPSPTTHELEDGIRAALAGKSVTHSEIRGVGCYISDLN